MHFLCCSLQASDLLQHLSQKTMNIKKKKVFKTGKLNFQICFVTFMCVITHLKTIYFSFSLREQNASVSDLALNCKTYYVQLPLSRSIPL